jgi:S1-C subfamily serine protease
MLIAARQPDGTIISAVGMSGGETQVRCGDRAYQELVLTTPAGPAFVGGGAFDLEGNLAGIVGRCGNRPVVLRAADIGKALQAGTALESRLMQSFGVRVVALDSMSRRYFAVDSGALVLEVVRDSPAGEAGLRPGDVIVAVDSLPVRSIEELAALPPEPKAGQSLAVMRDGRTTRIELTREGRPSSAPLGLDLVSAPEGLPVARVERGSRAAQAGLRAGDRLLRVGRLEPRTVDEAQRLLGRADREPLFLVYLRDGSERGVVLR